MKKSCLFLFMPLLLFIACSGSTSKVEGQFSDNTNDGKLVYLQTMNPRDLGSSDISILDSATVKDGKFHLKSDYKDTPVIGLVSVGKVKDMKPNENPVMASIVLEPGTIKLSFEKSTYSVEGTERNKELNKVITVLSKGNTMQEEIRMAGSLEAVPADENGQDIMARMQKIGKEIQDETFTFTKANMSNKVGEFMFMTSAESFTEAQLKELLALADSGFLALAPIKGLNDMLNGHAHDHDHSHGMDSKDVTFENVQLVDMNGKIVSLSDYVGKGKYVLVDFWATWCGPCIQEIPNLKKAYDAYKSKGFEIVGISLDQDKGAWKKMVSDKGMSWIQLHDTNQEAAVLYNVVNIPYTLLFDKEGKLVDMNLRGPKLENKLKELL